VALLGIGCHTSIEEKSLKRLINREFRAFLKDSKNKSPGGGSRTHTGSDPRQILSLLRLPVPPLREDLYENNMWRGGGKGREGCADESFGVIEILARSLRCATRRAKKRPARKGRVASVGLTDWVRLGGYGGSER
jgi:hypothetical protein